MTTEMPPVTGPPRRGRPASLVVLAGVASPGLIAGLSDDDPAGITTYSVLGASYGYRLLWVLGLSTLALILFHELGARVGVVTGRGLVKLIHDKFGARASGGALFALVVANIGTTTAEFAGVAAAGDIFGIPRYWSVPLAAILVFSLIIWEGFRVVERVLLALSSIFVAYIGAGILAKPDWGAALTGLVVPTLPTSRDAVLICTATLGTTLAPWGLSFIQSYAVDKKVSPSQLRSLRTDVIVGSVLTGVIGFFVVVACAATLHARGIQITDAASAAVALEPLAGSLAAGLFAFGLLGAALLAASVVPLSTAYSVCEAASQPAALNLKPREAPLFYSTYAVVMVVGTGLVLIPGTPLVSILVGTQVLNAVLLLPLLVYLTAIARDQSLMGDQAAGPLLTAASGVVIVLVSASVIVLLALSLMPQQ